ncbi:MAG: hypothetical protein M4579_003784 [Chaenotheca gracillima]|nr:MAG: hypothetical protein M4579_003784 [Chaenotheca gracillima]
MIFDFELWDDRHLIRQPSREEFRLMKEALPGLIGFLAAYPLLTLNFSELPPKPWPITVAGVPVFLRKPSDGISFCEMIRGPVYMGQVGKGGRLELSPTLELGKTPTTIFVSSLKRAIQARFGVELGDISWFGASFAIEVQSPPDFSVSSLPGVVGKSPIFYKTPSRKVPIDAALRQKVPDGVCCDDSNYGKQLRPGVLLNNGGDDENLPSLSTAAGLPVKSKTGQRYVTVGAHGFPGLDSLVYHPNRHGEQIGTLALKIGESDMGLAKLHDDIHFSNENFSTDDDDGPIFRDFRPVKEVQYGEIVSMDTPFSERCDGAVIGTLFQSLPPSSGNDEDDFIIHLWIYTGNGRGRMMAESCGSVIWDQDDKVIGFHRFVDDIPGLSCAVSSQCLQDLGMVIEEIL